VFTGDTAGRFRAFDQQNGKVLWEVNLGSEVSGYPIAFAVKGKQYIAVSTGHSLVGDAMNNLTGIKTAKTNAVYVFSLP
jgi:alcohol dehydrogenase (cytochrome c)